MYVYILYIGLHEVNFLLVLIFPSSEARRRQKEGKRKRKDTTERSNKMYLRRTLFAVQLLEDQFVYIGTSLAPTDKRSKRVSAVQASLQH